MSEPATLPSLAAAAVPTLLSPRPKTTMPSAGGAASLVAGSVLAAASPAWATVGNAPALASATTSRPGRRFMAILESGNGGRPSPHSRRNAC
jgi:hypothetical protein